MTFDEINIKPYDPRYKLQDKIADLVNTTQREEIITTAVLMGAVFHTTYSSFNNDKDWFIAEYAGQCLNFTERFSLHRCAVAFLICAKFFYGDEG